MCGKNTYVNSMPVSRIVSLLSQQLTHDLGVARTRIFPFVSLPCRPHRLRQRFPRSHCRAVQHLRPQLVHPAMVAEGHPRLSTCTGPISPDLKPVIFAQLLFAFPIIFLRMLRRRRRRVVMAFLFRMTQVHVPCDAVLVVIRVVCDYPPVVYPAPSL